MRNFSVLYCEITVNSKLKFLLAELSLTGEKNTNQMTTITRTEKISLKRKPTKPKSFIWLISLVLLKHTVFLEASVGKR